jgi:hypothetical protein
VCLPDGGESPTMMQSLNENAERVCKACGYDLRATAFGTACPECGAELQHGRQADESLDQAPVSIVIAVAWRILATSVVVLVLAPIAATLISYFAPNLGVIPVISVSALVATWLLSKPYDVGSARFNDLGPRNRLCQLVRTTSVIWLMAGSAAIAVAVLRSNTPQPAVAFGTFVSILLIAGCGQLVLLGIVLERIARWMRDDLAYGMTGFITFGTTALAIAMAVRVGVRLIWGWNMPILDMSLWFLGAALVLGAGLVLVLLSFNAAFMVMRTFQNRSI